MVNFQMAYFTYASVVWQMVLLEAAAGGIFSPRLSINSGWSKPTWSAMSSIHAVEQLFSRNSAKLA